MTDEDKKKYVYAKTAYKHLHGSFALITMGASYLRNPPWIIRDSRYDELAERAHKLSNDIYSLMREAEGQIQEVVGLFDDDEEDIARQILDDGDLAYIRYFEFPLKTDDQDDD